MRIWLANISVGIRFVTTVGSDGALTGLTIGV